MDDGLPLVNASPKRVGKQLRALRRKKGLSLSEVARGAGLTRRELVAYERGKVPIPESDLWVLAGACGVDVGELAAPTQTAQLAPGPSTIEGAIIQLRSGREELALARHLQTLAALRALPAGSRVQLEDGERASMVAALGGDNASIERSLVEHLRITPDEAVKLRELIQPSEPVAVPAALPPAEHAWFSAAPEPAPTAGPVDIFEELARLSDPVDAPEVMTAIEVEVPAIEPAAFAHDPARSATPVYATAAGGFAEVAPSAPVPDAAPELVDPHDPIPWTGHVTAPIDEARRAVHASWTNGGGTAGPAPVDPGAAPPGGVAPNAPSFNGIPVNGRAEPVEIVEFVDDWMAPGAPTAPAPEPYAPLPEPAANGAEWTPEPAAGPWDHEPDPAATSTGFVVDWGGAPDPAAGAEVGPASFATTTETPAPSPARSFEPAAGDEWSSAPAPDWSTSPVAGDAAASPTTFAYGEPAPIRDECPPISWRPLTEAAAPATMIAPAAFVPATAAPLGSWAIPSTSPVVAPEPERFVVAGSEWELGNAVPLVEVTGRGGLVMRRADERWALADVTTTPAFVVEVDVDFRSGPGFGVLFRASTDDAGHMSGYSFDVDPIHERGSYLVRQWRADRELWNPIACVAAEDPSSMHGVFTLRIVVTDDRMTAAVNGAPVLTVHSFEQACADRNREPALGDRVGIQAWSSSDLVIENLRVAAR